MRVHAQLARAVSRGAATVLYVPGNDRDRRRVRKGKTTVSRSFRAAAGDRLVLHGGERRGGSWRTTTTVFVDVQHAHQTPLELPGLAEARAAGYDTPDEFAAAWVRWHDRGWVASQVDSLTRLGVTPADAAETVDVILPGRFGRCHAGTPVWRLLVAPAHDLPRLLAEERGTPRTPGDLPDGYVHAPSQALQGEPEAVDVARLDRKWAERAEARRQKAQARHAAQKRARSLSARVQEAALRDPDHPALKRIDELLADDTQEAA